MTDSHPIDDVIAAQVRRYRLLKGWSVKRLAEECDQLGAPQLTVSSLGNIERGQDPEAKRSPRRVGAAELAVLAAALDVPPLALFVPLDGGRLDVTAKLTMTAMQAVDWFTALRPPTGMPTVGYQRAAGPLRLYAAASQYEAQAAELERAADRARQADDDEGRIHALAARDVHLQNLAHTLNALVDVGIQPPMLERRWIDLMATKGWLEHSDQIPAFDFPQEDDDG